MVPASPDSLSKTTPPTLEEAKQKLKDELVSFLQSENFPVGFNGIGLPRVSNGDLVQSSVDSEHYVHFSEPTQTRILLDILTDLKEKFSQAAIESKKQELQGKYDELELERMGHEDDIARPQEDRKGLEEFRQGLRKRCTEIEEEKAMIEEELAIIREMMPFSPEKIHRIESGLRDILISRKIYEKPPEKVSLPKKPPLKRVEEPVHVAVAHLPQPPEIRAQFTRGMRVAAFGTLLTVAAGTLGYHVYQDIRERTKEEEQGKQRRESCLKRHPEVPVWFGHEEAQKLTILQIEESSEKIALLKKYPHLETKYTGTKILFAPLMEILWQVPEEIKNTPLVHKQIITDWKRMCTEKKEEIMQLHFSGVEKYQPGIFSLFQRYHPPLKYADPEKLWSHVYRDDMENVLGLVSGSGDGRRKPIDANDDLRINLRIRGGDSFCIGRIGTLGEYTDHMLKDGIREVQKCINAGTEGCDIIHTNRTLPNNDVITNMLVSLLNKKCTLPIGKTKLELRSSSIMRQNDKIVEITLEIDVPAPECENMAIPITFQVNAN